jgi:polysaccharide export outer membrane protein
MHLPGSTFLRFLYAMIACLTGSWLLVSCITYKDVNYLQKPGQDVARYKDSIRFQEYKLQPGDRLSIMVYSLNEETNRLFQGNSENNQGVSGGMESGDLFTYKIDEKGLLIFPYVGKLEVAGKSLRSVKDDLEERIKSQFGNCYIRVNMANAYFSVIGEGGNGRYPLIKDKLNIFEALAISGDLSSFANRKQIKILRQTPTGTVVKTFDVRSQDIMHTEFYYLQPNDVIYVQKIPSHFFGVTSWSALLGTISTTISLLLLGISISKHF